MRPTVNNTQLIDPRHGHRVVAAAIRLDEHFPGLVVCGVRHFDGFMIAQLDALGIEKAFAHEQGFIDNKFEFLTREQAWSVALAAFQFDPASAEFDGIRGSLHSEDLW
jgi:hypothetical protein